MRSTGNIGSSLSRSVDVRIRCEDAVLPECIVKVKSESGKRWFNKL